MVKNTGDAHRKGKLMCRLADSRIVRLLLAIGGSLVVLLVALVIFPTLRMVQAAPAPVLTSWSTRDLAENQVFPVASPCPIAYGGDLAKNLMVPTVLEQPWSLPAVAGSSGGGICCGEPAPRLSSQMMPMSVGYRHRAVARRPVMRQRIVRRAVPLARRGVRTSQRPAPPRVSRFVRNFSEMARRPVQKSGRGVRRLKARQISPVVPRKVHKRILPPPASKGASVVPSHVAKVVVPSFSQPKVRPARDAASISAADLAKLQTALPTWFSAKPTAVLREEWGARGGHAVRECPVRYLVIHNTASTPGKRQSMRSFLGGIERYHLNKGWPGIAYQALIGLDGTLYEGFRQPGKGRDSALRLGPASTHAASFNCGSFGISLIGNYENQHRLDPHGAVAKSLRNMLLYAATRDGRALLQRDSRGRLRFQPIRLLESGKTIRTERPGRYASMSDPSQPITVLGHQQTGYSHTDCPGKGTHRALGEIVRQVNAEIEQTIVKNFPLFRAAGK